MNFVIRDCFFSKVKDSPINQSALKEFITNVIFSHSLQSVLLKNLSDIYIIVAHNDSDSLTEPNEKKWSEILSVDQYEILKANKYYVIGYMYVTEDDNVYIEYIESRVRGYYIGKYMIDSYDMNYNDLNKEIFPREIIESTVMYWKSYLCIETKEEMHEIIRTNDLKHIHWSYLEESLK